MTETDLVSFVSVTGMLEPVFVDATHEGAMGPRPVPAALTWSLIEGILLRTMLHGTGLACWSPQRPSCRCASATRSAPRSR